MGGLAVVLAILNRASAPDQSWRLRITSDREGAQSALNTAQTCVPVARIIDVGRL